LHTTLNQEIDRIEQAIALARAGKPAYAHLYSLLETLFISRAEAKDKSILEVPHIPGTLTGTKWEGGFPLLNRWDFPVDPRTAERVLRETGKAIPDSNQRLADAYKVLDESLASCSGRHEGFWGSFMHHEMEPWEAFIKMTPETDLASILFLARNAIRPTLEFTAEKLVEEHPIPDIWKGKANGRQFAPGAQLRGIFTGSSAPTAITAITNPSVTYRPKTNRSTGSPTATCASSTSNRSTQGTWPTLLISPLKNGQPCTLIFWPKRPDGSRRPRLLRPFMGNADREIG